MAAFNVRKADPSRSGTFRGWGVGGNTVFVQWSDGQLTEEHRHEVVVEEPEGKEWVTPPVMPRETQRLRRRPCWDEPKPTRKEKKYTPVGALAFCDVCGFLMEFNYTLFPSIEGKSPRWRHLSPNTVRYENGLIWRRI